MLLFTFCKQKEEYRQRKYKIAGATILSATSHYPNFEPKIRVFETLCPNIPKYFTQLPAVAAQTQYIGAIPQAIDADGAVPKNEGCGDARPLVQHGRDSPRPTTAWLGPGAGAP